MYVLCVCLSLCIYACVCTTALVLIWSGYLYLHINLLHSVLHQNLPNLPGFHTEGKEIPEPPPPFCVKACLLYVQSATFFPSNYSHPIETHVHSVLTSKSIPPGRSRPAESRRRSAKREEKAGQQDSRVPLLPTRTAGELQRHSFGKDFTALAGSCTCNAKFGCSTFIVFRRWGE